MSGDTDGASIVEQFRSPQAAADALGFYLRQVKAFGSYAPFKVTGIPHAVGFSIGVSTAAESRQLQRRRRLLPDRPGIGSTAAIAHLNTAARHLYHRVHG